MSRAQFVSKLSFGRVSIDTVVGPMASVTVVDVGFTKPPSVRVGYTLRRGDLHDHAVNNNKNYYYTDCVNITGNIANIFTVCFGII